MSIPIPPRLNMSDKPKHGCKIVIIAGKVDESYCIVGNDLEEGPIADLFHLPGTELLIESIARPLFKHPKINAFIAIKKGEYEEKPVYTLQPLREADAKKYQKGELVSEEIERVYIPPPPVSHSGTYGSVKLYPTEKIAIKTSLSQTDYGDISGDMVKEIAIYRLLKEISCLPNFYDFKAEGKTVRLQFELGKVLSEVNITDFSEMQTIMFRLIKCLRASASQGVIHADLKTDNMVISPNGTVQIIDWGVSEIDHSKGQMRKKSTFKQTLWWRAPELANTEKPDQMSYSYKIDVFSLGLIFLGFFMGVQAVVQANSLIQYQRTLLRYFLDWDREQLNTSEKINTVLTDVVKSNEVRSSIIMKNLLTNPIFLSDGNEKMPEELADLISHMLEFSPNVRSTYDELILHPFFQKMNREAIPKLPVFINNMPIIPDITNVWKGVVAPNARKQLLEWIREINEDNRTSFETLCLSFQLLDLLVYTKPELLVSKNIQGYACACMSLASKIYEFEELNIKMLSTTTAGFQTIEQIVEYEMKLLLELNGNLIIPSYYSYYSHKHDEEPASTRSQRHRVYTDLYDIYMRNDIYSKPFYSQLFTKK